MRAAPTCDFTIAAAAAVVVTLGMNPVRQPASVANGCVCVFNFPKFVCEKTCVSHSG